MIYVKAVLEILALLLPFLIDWKEQSPIREGKNNVQDAREALAKNDGARFDALSADAHDRVRQALRYRKR